MILFDLRNMMLIAMVAALMFDADTAFSEKESITSSPFNENEPLQKTKPSGLSNPEQPSKRTKKRQRRKHSHGKGTLEIALERGMMSITLDIPAHDAVGFEHPPRTPEQEKAVRSAVSLLKNPDKLMSFPKAARCASVKKPQVRSEQFSALQKRKEEAVKPDDGTLKTNKEAHKKKHKHKKGHDHRNEHSAFLVKLSVRCAEAKELKSVDVKVFQAFPRLGLLSTVVFSEKAQSVHDLTKNNATLSLPEAQ